VPWNHFGHFGTFSEVTRLCVSLECLEISLTRLTQIVLVNDGNQFALQHHKNLVFDTLVEQFEVESAFDSLPEVVVVAISLSIQFDEDIPRPFIQSGLIPCKKVLEVGVVGHILGGAELLGPLVFGNRTADHLSLLDQRPLVLQLLGFAR
jgi:hypothetical protein